MKHFLHVCIIVSLVLLSGCFGKEDPIQPFPRGDVSSNSIAMSANYADQFFFSLDRNTVVKTIDKTLWDISFSCIKGDPTIRLNTGKNMYAAKTPANELFDISDTSGLKFNWDWSNGKDDSTALFGYEKTNEVYMINLGIDAAQNALGFVVVKFQYKNENLEIQYAQLGSRTARKFTLLKDEAYNAVYFNFANNEQVDVEPKKEEYDIVFRQYIYYFAPEKLAYLVVGTLINPYNTRVSRIFDKDFADIELADTAKNPFSNNADVIGYDWKEFKLSDGVYVVYANQIYLIQDNKGFYYKLHFTDFYSKTGERGHPGFEFKRM